MLKGTRFRDEVPCQDGDSASQDGTHPEWRGEADMLGQPPSRECAQTDCDQEDALIYGHDTPAILAGGNVGKDDLTAGEHTGGSSTGGQIVLADISTSQNRGRVMAIYQGVFLVTVGLGAFPGGWLAEHVSLAAPFWVCAILAGAVAILAWYFVPETRALQHRSAQSMVRSAEVAPGSSWVQLRQIASVPGFALISLVGFATVAARTGALFNVIPILAEDKIGLVAGEIGVGLGAISIFGLLLVYPSGSLVDRFGRKAVIVPSTILSSGALVLFGLATSFEAYLLASIVWSAASGISGASPAAYAADIAPPGMIASSMGMFRAISDSGYVIGPLALGALADATSSVTALQVTAAIMLLISFIFAIGAPESLHREPASA